MRRVLAFLIAVVGCIALIVGVYTRIGDSVDDLSFTGTVHFGDPAVMEGKTVSMGLLCGDHMRWDIEYRFGETDVWDTVFRFSQQSLSMPDPIETEPLSFYSHTGWGITSGGLLHIGQSDYAELLQTAIAMTPDGEKQEIRLKLKDFVDYAACNFHLHYTSDKYWCDEYVDAMNAMLGEDIEYSSPAYIAFSQLFRFPVQEEQIVSVIVEKMPDGGVYSLNFSDDSGIQANVVNTATDEGFYCVPVYTRGHDAPEAIPGEYAQGMGIYFIPWKIVENAQIISQSHEVTTLDVDNAKNICPLPETTIVYDILVDGSHAWMLSLENGTHFLTKLDLEKKEVLSRIELMAHDPESADSLPDLISRNGLIAVQESGYLALVRDGEKPTLEFIAPVGEAARGFHYYTPDTGNLMYEDGILYLADLPYYSEQLTVMVFDASGPLYWGEYACELARIDHRNNANPDVHPDGAVIGLK